VTPVVPNITIAQIAMQVLRADVMIHPIDTAFQNGRISVDSVGADKYITLVGGWEV